MSKKDIVLATREKKSLIVYKAIPASVDLAYYGI